MNIRWEWFGHSNDQSWRTGLLPDGNMLTYEGLRIGNARVTEVALAVRIIERTVTFRRPRGEMAQMVDAMIGERPSC